MNATTVAVLDSLPLPAATIDHVYTERFTLDLFSSDRSSCSEFNYQQLLRKMKKNVSNFEDGDDNDQLKALAKKFEEKYGAPTTSTKKSKEKYNDFVDIGYGYDDADDFIDNTEAYDEVVPSGWTTEHGGFYINQGNLDFRPVERNENKKDKSTTEKKKKKKVLNKDNTIIQKKKKLIFSKEKQRKIQASVLKAQKILKKKKKPLVIIDDTSQDGLPLSQLNKSLEDDVPLAKIAKSNLVESTKITKTNSLDESLPLSNLASTPKLSTTPSNRAVTTVTVNKATVVPTTVPSIASTPVTSSTANTDNAKTATPKVFIPLPEGLSQDLLQDIEELKKFSAVSVKGKFFTPDVNKVLLNFARKCREQSPKFRNTIYDHVLYYLPCARDTLVKRCRALVVQYQRDLEDEPMKLLQQGIDASMPEQKKLYEEEVAKALQEQAREQIKQTGMDPKKPDDSENATNSEDKIKKNFPKKKYFWSDEVRKLLCDVIRVRVGLFKMSKSKSMTAEEYVKDFLESEIRKIWPKGWMTSRILYKESRGAHQEITQPVTKSKKVTKNITPPEDTKIPITTTSAKNSTTVSTKPTIKVVTTSLATSTLVTNLSTTTLRKTSSVMTITHNGSMVTLLANARKGQLNSSEGNPSSTAVVRTVSTIAGGNKMITLPYNLKIVANKTLAQSKSNFSPTIEKNTLMKTQVQQKNKPTFMKIVSTATPFLSSTAPSVHTTPHAVNVSATESKEYLRPVMKQDEPAVSPYLNTTPNVIRTIFATANQRVTPDLPHDSRLKQMKRKTPTGASDEGEIASKKSTTNKAFIFSPQGSTERSWSEMEHNLARISKEASHANQINQSINLVSTTASRGKNESLDNRIQLVSEFRGFNKITDCHYKGVNRTDQIAAQTYSQKVASSSSNRPTPMRSFALTSKMTKTVAPSLHRAVTVPSYHQSQAKSKDVHTNINLSHYANLNQHTLQQHIIEKPYPHSHQSPEKSPVKHVLHTSPLNTSPLNTPKSVQRVIPVNNNKLNSNKAMIHEKQLQFHAPQHPAMRLKHTSDQVTHNIPSSTSPRNQLEHHVHASPEQMRNQAILHSSHPTMKLMSELHKGSLGDLVTSKPLSHQSHQLSPSQNMYGGQNILRTFSTPPDSQRVMTVEEQQIELIKRELQKRGDPQYHENLYRQSYQ